MSGLRFLSHCEFISAAIDQKVVKWKVSCSNGPIDTFVSDGVRNKEHWQTTLLSAIDSHVSPIADISSIELFPDNGYGYFTILFVCDNYSFIALHFSF